MRLLATWLLILWAGIFVYSFARVLVEVVDVIHEAFSLVFGRK